MQTKKQEKKKEQAFCRYFLVFLIKIVYFLYFLFSFSLLINVVLREYENSMTA